MPKRIKQAELLVAEIYDRPADTPAPASAAAEPHGYLSAYLTEAIGSKLLPDEAHRLDDCGAIATDRLLALRAAGREHPLRDLSSDGPVGRRLGPWLLEQVPDQPARRSVVRLLVGTYRRPTAGLLYHFAAVRPAWVPIGIRESWAADAIDLDANNWSIGDRKWIRACARQAFLATQLSDGNGELDPAS